MPDFQNPAAFLMLLLIPALYIFRKTGIFTRFSFIVTFSDWNGKAFEWNKPVRNISSVLSKVAALTAFVFVVIAFSQPVLYKQERVYTSRGTDVVFVIDVSPSMAAKDIGGLRRLDAAKNAILEIVEMNSGATFGAVAMAQESAIVIPPTIDRKVFSERLNSLAIGQLGNGTALGTGLSTAVFHLSGSQAPKKCIVLVTDGENNAGSIHPETAAELAKRNNITVYILGVGTSGSVPIEYIDPKTGQVHSGYYESEFDTSGLESIAQSAGGRYFGIESTAQLSQSLSLISQR